MRRLAPVRGSILVGAVTSVFAGALRLAGIRERSETKTVSTKMQEKWKDILGFEGRYQVSDLGRVKSLAFMQRYLLRNGKEAFRRTRERMLAQQPNNGGYLLVKLWLNNKETTFTVHGLVARAFVLNWLTLPEVNHIDGVKANCAASNLEWKTSSGNKVHAVDIGLNSRALRVIDPISGVVYPSARRAAKAVHCRAQTARKIWSRA